MSDKRSEADILLDKQLEMSVTTKKSDIILSVIFLLLIFGITILFWALPDNDYSGAEKRQLKQLPEISASRFANEFKQGFNEIFMTYDEKQVLNANDSMFDEIAEYYADQFPIRDSLRALKGYTEMVLFKQQSNGILFANGGLADPDTITGTTENENGVLTDRTEQDALKTIEKNVAFINILNKRLEQTDTKLFTAVAGRTIDVSKNVLPLLYPSDKNDAFWAAYDQAVEKTGINSIDLLEQMRYHVENGEYVYYKTDHHWTSLGAYYAYVEIMKSFGELPLTLDHFTQEIASENFLGTVYASAGVAPNGADTITLFRYDGDDEFTTTIPVGKEITTLNGFYNTSYFSTKDQYSAFLGHENPIYGGNNPITFIKKNTTENRETLVLIKDSFAHSVAPFLAFHYDLVILDMRYYLPDGKDLKTVLQYAQQDNVSKILILYNMETFMNDESLMRIVQ